MRTCVVTGVSTGIGEAIATDLVRRGWRVVGTVRRMDDAERLDAALGPSFTPVIADVTDPDSLSRAATTVAGLLDGKPLDGLVCNAGISLPGPSCTSRWTSSTGSGRSMSLARSPPSRPSARCSAPRRALPASPAASS